MASKNSTPYRGFDIRKEDDTSYAIYCSGSFVTRCASLTSAVSHIDGLVSHKESA